MIRFYFGAGSDETAAALTRDVLCTLESGAEVLLLVPEQETVAVERRMLRELPAAYQLTFEVVNFSRLANRIHRTLGGHRFKSASAPVRSLMMWNALRQSSDALIRYKGHAHETRLCDMMLEAATRYHAHCIKAKDLKEMADKLPETEALRAKLLDISCVMAAFEDALTTTYGDGNELGRAAARLMQHKELLANTHIFVDSFHDFTGEEHEMLQTLAACAASISFTTPLQSEADHGLHLHTAARTYRRLCALEKEPTLLPYTVKEPQSAREYLARNLFRMEAEAKPLSDWSTQDVSLTLCADPFAEADAAVAKIQELVRAGCHYRDVAIVTREADAWVGILDAALERDGIPFYLSEKTDVTVRPLVKMLLLALRIRLYGWRDQDMISYAKTGLCDVSPDDVNCFEEYVNLWHPRGMRAYERVFTQNPDGFTPSRSERGERILSGANRTREALFPPLCALETALDGAKNATEMCRAIYAFMREMHLADKLRERAEDMLATGNVREAEELSRLFGVTVDALDAIAGALGTQALSTEELYDALRLVLARTDMGTIPTAIDEVTVGSASMLRTDHPKHVIVLGLNEGSFPAPVKDSSLITEAERARLESLGLPLPGAREDQSANEMFFLHRAFGAAGEGLYLYFSANAADGAALVPSIAVTRTQKLLALDPKNPDVFASHDPISATYSVGAVLDRLSSFDTDTRGTLVQLLRDLNVPAVRALDTPVRDPQNTIEAQTAASVYESAHVSASLLEKFSQCPFAYYCNYVLSLREKKTATPSFADSGNFVHHVLEHVVKSANKCGERIADWDDARLDSVVREIASAYCDELRAINSDLTPRSEALLARLTTLTHHVVRSLHRELADSDFTPALTELSFSQIEKNPSVTLKNGDTISLSGKIDRLDLWRAPDGNAYVRVIDYKTGAISFSPSSVAKGESLQMPLYLKALCDAPHPALNRILHLPEHTQLTPAGVTYFSSKLEQDNSKAAKNEESYWKEAEEALVRSGVLLDHEDVRHAASHTGNTQDLLSKDGFDRMFDDLDTALTNITSDIKNGLADADPRIEGNSSACDFCDLAAVCRVAKKKREDF